jgi:hypothetical protein
MPHVRGGNTLVLVLPSDGQPRGQASNYCRTGTPARAPNGAIGTSPTSEPASDGVFSNDRLTLMKHRSPCESGRACGATPTRPASGARTRTTVVASMIGRVAVPGPHTGTLPRGLRAVPVAVDPPGIRTPPMASLAGSLPVSGLRCRAAIHAGHAPEQYEKRAGRAIPAPGRCV